MSQRIVIDQRALRVLEPLKSTHEGSASLVRLRAELGGAGPVCTVWHVDAARRALWRTTCHPGVDVWFVAGVSADGREDELRIVHAGSPNEAPAPGEILRRAGELLPGADPDTAAVIERRDGVEGFPPMIAARIDKCPGGLSMYLEPTDEQAEVLLEVAAQAADEELHAGRYNMFVPPFSVEESWLRLNKEQEDLIDMDGPLQVQGIAGSGKTTVLTHIAARRLREEPDATVLVVVYQDQLRHYVRSILDSLNTDPEDERRLQVFTYNELCDYICSHVIHVDGFNWVTSAKQVEAFLRAHRKGKKLAAQITIPALLDEFRACIKGRCVDPERALVPLSEYRKWAPGGDRTLHVGDDLKGDIYSLAELYQGHLEGLGLSDEMDAARFLLKWKLYLSRWDHVLIDEVQDYTLVQLRLLSQLAKSARGLIFAGDEHQVVHASQFSWDRVTEALRGVSGGGSPVHRTITMNYRNPRPVVELSREVLKNRLEREGRSDVPVIGATQQIEPKPIRAVVKRHTANDVLRQLAQKVPSLGVIFADQDEVEQQRWKFQGRWFRRGFSPQSAKGLEFEIVCLVRFGERFADLGHDSPNRTRATEVFQFNQLYVSITRPRRLLILLDEEAPREQLWDQDRYATLVASEADADALIERAHQESEDSGAASWSLAAFDFERQEAWAPAAECWEAAQNWVNAGACHERRGDPDEALRCYRTGGAGSADRAARMLEQLDRHEEAAELFASAGMHMEAARAWERVDRYAEATGQWEAAGEPRRAAAARAVLFERRGADEEARKAWEEAHYWRNAAECAERLQDFKGAAELWDRCGDVKRRAFARGRYLEDGRLNPEAAEAYEVAGFWIGAGRCHERNGAWDKAATAWKKANDMRRHYAARAMGNQIAERFEEAGKLYEKAEDFSMAEQMWRTAGRPRNEKAARAMHAQSEGRWRDAAELWQTLRRPKNAAKAWARAGELDSAVEMFDRLRMHRESAKILEKADRLLEAAERWRRADIPFEADRLTAIHLERKKDHLGAAALWNRIGVRDRAAREFTTGGAPEAAADAWEDHANEMEAQGKFADARTARRLAQECWEKLLANVEATPSPDDAEDGAEGDDWDDDWDGDEPGES